ncbi:LysR family transcriptional regulator, partial [Streptomyces sp. SID9124]|nr:LysR family transcriptional regulator [Streptomyces sp. SID9124]
PRRHVVAAVRRGAEEAPAVARVVAALREAAEPYGESVTVQ